MNKYVFVGLKNEGTEVFRPVKALLISNNVYQIIQPMPKDEEWDFQTGEKVICKEKLLDGELHMVAMERAEEN